MSTRNHLHTVAAALQPVVHGVSDHVLDHPTPCTEFDVSSVASHMLGTIEAIRRVGAREPLDPHDPWGANGAELVEDWRRELSEKLRALADAWALPEAWEGDALDGAMPRQLVGDMGYVEMILHGWDLARGSGQNLELDQPEIDRAQEILDVIAEQGRAQGAFGPEVKLSGEADDFSRVLALSGRDPEWSAR